MGKYAIRRVVLGIVLVASTASGADPQAAFEMLTEKAVTTMALTEDGRLLVLAHEGDGEVTVWDVASGEPVKLLKTPSPSSVLCRGDLLVVANDGKGTLSVYSIKDGFRAVGQIKLDLAAVGYLTAPRGKYFTGRLLALCGEAGRKSNKMRLIDLGKKYCLKLPNPPNTSSSFVEIGYGGRAMLIGDKLYDFRNLLSGISKMNFGIEAAKTVEGPQQLHDRAPWLGARSLYVGPEAYMGKSFIHVPLEPSFYAAADQRVRKFYLVSLRELSAYTLDAEHRLLGRRKVRLPTPMREVLDKQHPKAHERDTWRLVSPRSGGGTSLRPTDPTRRWITRVSRPLAVTLGKKLVLFVLDNKNRLYSCRTPAFADKPAKAPTLPQGAVVFSRVPLTAMPTTMAMTEDGRHVLIAHEEAGQITVCDTTTGKRVATLKCPSPRFILSRGDKVYVACYGKGAIRVFSRGQGWKTLDELAVSQPGVYYLSAPGGKHFKEQILAVCDTAAENRVNLFMVDAAKDTCRQLGPSGWRMTPHALATFSFDGKYINSQQGSGEFHGLSGTTWPSAGWLEGKPSGPPRGPLSGMGRPSTTINTVLFQVREGLSWFGGPAYHSGMPPVPEQEWLGTAVVPDLTRPFVHAITADSVVSYVPRASLEKVATSPVVLPPAFVLRYQRSKKDAEDAYRHKNTRIRFYGARRTDRGYIACFPQAATIADKTYLYLFDPEKPGLYRAAMRAPGAPVAGAKQPTTSPLAAGAGKAMPTGTGVFERVSTDYKVATIAITEDGGQLLLCHEPQNKITVWDVRTGRLAATLDTPAPQFIMPRGDDLYVANADKGTVSVFSRSTGAWKQDRTIKFPQPRIVYLSAPGGKHFRGRFLANYSLPNASGVFLVEDSGTSATVKQVAGICEGYVDYAGSIVSIKDHTSRGTSRYAFDILGDQKGIWGVSRPDRRIRYQVRDNTYWFGISAAYRHTVYEDPGPRGLLLSRRKDIAEGVLVPDCRKDLLYVVGPKSIEVIDLRPGLPRLGAIPAKAPKWPGKPGAVTQFKWLSVTLRRPIAVTLDGKLYIFIVEINSGNLYRCAVKAWDRPAGPKTPDKPPKSSFPKFVPVGREFVRRILPKGTPGPISVISVPSGAKVSPDGEFRWTPTPKDVGDHQIKVKVPTGGQTRILRIKFSVVTAALAHAAGGKLQDLANLGMHHVITDQYYMANGLGGRSILLLNGRLLRVLDPDGQAAVRTVTLPGYYRAIGEREEYYVALGYGGVDLVDKKTLKVIRHITFDCVGVKTVQMAMHPKRAYTYVSLDLNPSRPEPMLKNHPVYQVDEKTGKATAIKYGYGPEIAVDVRGRYLYTAPRGRCDPKNSARLLPKKRPMSSSSNDAVFMFSIAGTKPFFRMLNYHAARGVGHLRPTPNGMYLLCTGGAYLGQDPRTKMWRSDSAAMPVLNAANIARQRLIYKCRGGRDARFSPTRDLLAILHARPEKAPVFLVASTGRILDESPVGFTEAKIYQFTGLFFTPGGKHLLVGHYDTQRRHVIRAFPLKQP